MARRLIESGLMTIMLDGLNEVQDLTLQKKLVGDLNRLTEPGQLSANSRWIVSSRVYSYQRTYYPLTHLEVRRWEVQPLTADLIYASWLTPSATRRG
jgi:hypothetical protein